MERPYETASAQGRSLAERVYDELRSDIFHVRLRPGDALMESRLAERFEVSKTPVREALRLLAHHGLVTVLPRRGYIVRELDPREVRELYVLRSLIQPLVTADAALRRTPEQLVRMHALLPGLDRVRPGETPEYVAGKDYAGRLLLGYQWAELVCDMAGDGRASRIQRELIFDSHRLWLLLPPRQQDLHAVPSGTVAQMAHAIERKDAEEARRAAVVVVEQVFGRLVDRIAEPV